MSTNQLSITRIGVCIRACLSPAFSRQLSLVIALLASSHLVVANAQVELLNTHDLVEKGTNNYQVAGNDPYWVFKPKASELPAQFLKLNITTSKGNRPAELFFKQRGNVFDPWYRLSFNAPGNGDVAIRIPDTVQIEVGQTLRLDINRCGSCDIKFSTASLSQTSDGAAEVEITRLFNGIQAVDDSGKLITLDDWQLNDVAGLLSGFTITNNDPYLVSPDLNVGTQNLAAVYFKVSVPKNANVNNDYQLFYATEKHAFIEPATSLIRLENDSAPYVELLFPLDFLSREIPADSLLQKVRLDLPLIEGKWSLDEAKLLSFAQLEHYQNSAPRQLVQYKRQRSSGLALIKKSLMNVFSDLGFVFSYLLLLIAIAFGFIRAFKK